MKNIFHGMARFARLLCVICCVPVTTGAQAAIDVIDSIDITPGRDQSTIHIRLTIPVSYKSHAPERSGDLLRIFVEPAPSLGSAGDTLLGEQTIQWSPDRDMPLYDVTYEGAGFANTSITLRFQKEVEFEIPRSGDFRTIDVVVKHPQSRGNPGASAVEDVLHAGPGNRPDSDSTTPVAIMTEATAANTEVPVEAATTATLYPYVINLASSVTPFEVNDLPDPEVFMDLPDPGESQAYRVYTTTFVKDGKTWYRLRFGFFRKVQQADIVREELKAYYPDSWVAKASVAERTRSGESMLAGNLSGSGAGTTAQPEATTRLQSLFRVKLLRAMLSRRSDLLPWCRRRVTI